MHVRSLVQATQLSSRNVFMLMTVVILVALAILLATAAFVQNDELSEDYDGDEFSIFANWGTILPTLSFLLTIFIPIRWMGVKVGLLGAADLGGGILAPPFFS
jgi:ABC-type multidrug transport system fused ATPase/permease subunit